MLVVADASPINYLVRLDCIFVLEPLFRSVVIPTEVERELSQPSTPPQVRAFVHHAPGWFSVRTPQTQRPWPELDAGESAAINLALDLSAEALLIDDKDGRRAAIQTGLEIIGTLGILELAAARSLIHFPDAAQRLAQTDFRIHPELVRQALGRDAERRKTS